jgi:hypothetical protein
VSASPKDFAGARHEDAKRLVTQTRTSVPHRSWPDVIVEYGGGRIFAFEIKTSSAPKRDDIKHLTWLRDELGDRFIGGAVLHTGPRPFMFDDRIAAAPMSVLWA